MLRFKSAWIIGLAISFGLASVLWAHNAEPWHYRYQWDRDRLIIDRANRDNGSYVGLNCKEWVKKVVKEASSSHVTIPLTEPDENGWYWANDPAGHTVRYYADIADVSAGDIIQMNWRQNNGVVTPHTFIVTWVFDGGFEVIESNWGVNNQLRVTKRSISFTEFRTKAIYYSIYYIK